MSLIARYTIALILIIVIGGIYLNFTAPHTEEHSFDSTLWSELKEESMLNDPGCVRGGMALSLIRNKRLTGLHISDVAELLGEANEPSTPTEFRYSLGQCHWDWKHSSMVVRFNVFSIVTNTFIEVEKHPND
jgi:hypothetical protein